MEHLHTTLPEDVMAWLRVMLHSEAQHKVPAGAYQKFFTELLRERMARTHLDLAPYINGLVPGSLIYGPPPIVDELRTALQLANHVHS